MSQVADLVRLVQGTEDTPGRPLIAAEVHRLRALRQILRRAQVEQKLYIRADEALAQFTALATRLLELPEPLAAAVEGQSTEAAAAIIRTALESLLNELAGA